MDHINNLFRESYQNFNGRKIDLVISKMTEHVKWANGMDGGYVYGHQGVTDYWPRQFTTVSSNVTPIEIREKDNVVKIKVHQVVHDLNGELLADEIVFHYFHLQQDQIAEFDIGEKTGS
jgi:hypothetical protein